MTSYLTEADSESDNEKSIKITSHLSEDEIEEIVRTSQALKSEGNVFFSKSEYEEAVTKYTEAINVLKTANLPKDSLLLLNRSATYLALKRYVPALNDSNQAIMEDPLNWKGHWRKGVALMSMSKRAFRTKQAIEAFESCLKCDTLPANKLSEVKAELSKARFRLEQQDAETPPADLSRCAPS